MEKRDRKRLIAFNQMLEAVHAGRVIFGREGFIRAAAIVWDCVEADERERKPNPRKTRQPARHSR
jgi:hypothetical protein